MDGPAVEKVSLWRAAKQSHQKLESFINYKSDHH
jgi:hypothetical protein